MRADRVSLRQAVVVLPLTAKATTVPEFDAAAEPDRRSTVLLATLLDVIGALVRVDGVTISVLAEAEDDLVLRTKLPAGIELLTLHEITDANGPVSLHAALGVLLERGFDRAVGIAGDVIGLTPRIAATALSALGEADVVLGPTRGGLGYLVGVRDRVGIDAFAANGVGTLFGGWAAGENLDVPGLTVRRVQPLPRLAELGSLLAISEAAQRDPRSTPRLTGALAPRAAIEHGA